MGAPPARCEAPPMDGVRPTRCPRCDAPARDGPGIVVRGHGVRFRRVVVPGDEHADLIDVWTRRFRCKRCNRTCSVRPVGIQARHVYTLTAILTAWFLASAKPLGDGLDHVEVYARQGVDRPRCKPLPEAGRSGCRRWRSLSRWAASIERGWPSRPVHGATWATRVHALLIGFLPGVGGRDGAIRRAKNAHAAAGAAM